MSSFTLGCSALRSASVRGDSSYPGFYKQLERQNGRGYIHESEGSVITDVWRSSVANYNTALRKAAEHEPITRNRANFERRHEYCSPTHERRAMQAVPELREGGVSK